MLEELIKVRLQCCEWLRVKLLKSNFRPGAKLLEGFLECNSDLEQSLIAKRNRLSQSLVSK